MRRRLYVDPESGGLEDCSTHPYSWDGPFCVVLRDNEDLWSRYLAAQQERDAAVRAVLAAAAEEPMTLAEQAISARSEELFARSDLDSAEFLRRNAEIEAAAAALMEERGDGSALAEGDPP